MSRWFPWRSMTDFMIWLYVGFTVTITSSALIVLFVTEYSVANWITVATISVSCLAIYGVLMLLRTFVTWIYKRSNTEVLARFRKNFLIGSVGIWICGMVPRVGVYFIESNFNILAYFLIVFPVTFIIFYYLFIFPSSRLTKLDYKNYKTTIIVSIIAQLFIALAMIGIAEIYTGDMEFKIISICQIIFGLLSLPSTTDFFVVVLGGLHSKTDDVDDENQKNLKLKSIKVIKGKGELKLECKMCGMEYSDSKIPRILKECGHTVCEGCAGILLADERGSHYLICPFCQKTTVVNGAAYHLPKNYVMADLVEKKELLKNNEALN